MSPAGCAGHFDVAIPAAVDYKALAATMLAQGFIMPLAFQFRSNAGTAIPPPLGGGSFAVMQGAFDQCAAASGGQSPGVLLESDQSPGGFQMAKDVVAQLSGHSYNHVVAQPIVAG